MRVIRDYEREEPFCIFLGRQYPHPPYQIEEPYFSAIDKKALPGRLIMDEEDMAKKPRILQKIRENQRLGDLTEEDWDGIRSCYLGMCRKVDDYFRQVCETLKEKGLYEDTAIFFFSDHGDYTGDYGIVEKTQNTFEDCLTNVPFLIKPPKGYALQSGIRDSLVELVDFYATAMEMCGIPPSHSHFGRSLTAVLADPAKHHREFVCCEGGRLAGEIHCDESNGGRPNLYDPYYPRKCAQLDDVAHTKAAMLRTDRYKYVRRLYEPDEFYDLKEDPGELHNVIDDPRYGQIIGRLQMQLLDWYQETTDVVPYAQDDRFSFEMIWNRVKLLCRPKQEAEVKERIRNGEYMFLLMEALRKEARQEEGEQN